MAKYAITAPDGHTYEVQGEGTEAEALAHFQSTWKPAPDYSNEGRNRPPVTAPEPGRVDSALGMFKDTAMGAGKIVKDADIGLLKSAVDNAASVSDALPGAKMLKMLGKTKGVTPVEDAQKLTQRLYDEAGPAAFVGKLGGDVAVSGGGANAVGNTVGALLKGKVPQMVAGAGNVATAGAAGGALLPPSEDETRAGNALKGAAGATVLGGLGKLYGYGKQAANAVLRNAEARAGAWMEKAGVNIPAVTNELQAPRHLPMTTAAAGGDEALYGIEKALRREPMKDPGRYAKLDDATNEEAWNKLSGVLDDSATRLPQRQIAKQDAMSGVEQQLDKVKLKADDIDSMALQLEQLRMGKAHGAKFIERGDQKALNDAIVAATNPNATLGSLARLHTNLNDPSLYPFTTPGNAQLVRDRVKAMIDSRAPTKGMWSTAEKQFKSTLQPLEESKAANEILSDFQEPIGGMAKGAKAPTTIPQVTEARLRGSVNTRGVDKTDPLAPVDRLNPVDRQQLEQLVADKLKAESVTQSKAIAAELPGGRGGALPTSKAQAARSMISNLIDTRARGTREAMDRANMSVEGWEKMVKAAEADKRITASDAAMLVRILRGAGPTAGALAQGDNNAP